MCRLHSVLLPSTQLLCWKLAQWGNSAPQPHEAQQQAAQPQHKGRPTRLYSNPDSSQLPERLQRQWDKDRNALWPRPVVTHGSQQLAWWWCDCCSAGKQHSWQAIVQSRVKETGTHCCSFSSGTKVCKHCNSLAARYPMVAAEWDKGSNAPKQTPQTVPAHSRTKAHWIGRSCGHRWEASIENRTRKGTGCPFCNRGRPATGRACKHPCLADFAQQKGLMHLITEWDKEGTLRKAGH